jgi:adenylate kinase
MAKELPPIACIDTHAMIKTPIGYCPGIPEGVIRILKPNVIGMIECSASAILERRNIDKTRRRDYETIEQIDFHLQISRSFLLSCVAISGALYAPIQNEGAPSDGAKQLINLIQSYKS